MSMGLLLTALRSSRPHVCLVGADDVHLRLPFVQKLQDRGFKITVMGTMNGEQFAEAGVSFIPYSLTRRMNPFADWCTLRKLTSHLRQIRPDVVHAFDTKPGLMVPFAGARAGVRSAMRTITGMGMVFSSSSVLAKGLQGVYCFLQARASKLSSVTVFQNRDDQEFFLARCLVDPDYQRLILGSGVDLGTFSPVQARERHAVREDLGISDKVTFIMVARLVREKGVADYLEAARAVRRERPNTRFLLVGPSDVRGANAVSVDEVLRYGDDVSYLGARSDIATLLHACDVFVLPTKYREGIPRTLLEAGAVGLPLVATDAPGCRDAIRHGWNGLTVPPGDVVALRNALIALTDDPSARETMGSRSAQHVTDNFGIDSVVAAYADLYEQVWRNAQND